MTETVVVTGAGAGVGRAVAREFARLGYNVALLGRHEERLRDAAGELRPFGIRSLPISVDVADAEALDAAASRVESDLGSIAIWVNNAMVTMFAPVADMRADEFRRVTEVTYLGQVYGTMAALKRMRPRDAGTIVQVGSALSYRAIPLQSAYCGAKFAVRGFTDALRTELEHEGSRIRVTMVQLPAVNTPQFDWARSRMPRKLQPVPPIYQPEAVAREIVRAAHDAPRELWIGGSALKAIVGTMLVPQLADYVLAANGIDGQMTSEPASRTRPDNLFAAAPGGEAAHGRFDDRAQSTVFAFNPAWVRAGALCGVFGAVAAAFLVGRISGRNHSVSCAVGTTERRF